MPGLFDDWEHGPSLFSVQQIAAPQRAHSPASHRRPWRYARFGILQ